MIVNLLQGSMPNRIVKVPLADARTRFTGTPVRRTSSLLRKPVPTTTALGITRLIMSRAVLRAAGAVSKVGAFWTSPIPESGTVPPKLKSIMPAT